MGNLIPVLGIVCGMAIEVRALGPWADDPRISIGISGTRPDRAASEARRLVSGGCRVLLSWGVAGGLDPALRPGDLVMPAGVVTEDGGRWVLSANLGAAVVAGVASPLLGTDHIVLDVAAKTDLYNRTGAVAVDMESHRVAQVAAEAGLPALAIRAIGDPAGRALPALVGQAIGEDGRPRIGRVIAGLLRRPGDLGALLQAKRDTDAALRALAGIADQVMPPIIDGC